MRKIDGRKPSCPEKNDIFENLLQLLQNKPEMPEAPASPAQLSPKAGNLTPPDPVTLAPMLHFCHHVYDEIPTLPEDWKEVGEAEFIEFKLDHLKLIKTGR